MGALLGGWCFPLAFLGHAEDNFFTLLFFALFCLFAAFVAIATNCLLVQTMRRLRCTLANEPVRRVAIMMRTQTRRVSLLLLLLMMMMMLAMLQISRRIARPERKGGKGLMQYCETQTEDRRKLSDQKDLPQQCRLSETALQRAFPGDATQRSAAAAVVLHLHIHPGAGGRRREPFPNGIKDRADQSVVPLFRANHQFAVVDDAVTC